MNNYIILSNRPWNNSLLEMCKSLFPNDNWIYIEKKDDLTKKNIKSLKPNFIFIPHWSYIIKKEIYDSYNCIVFHMTDLPFGRGGSPLQNLISRGIDNTKISAIKVVKELDAGPVYLKKDLNLNGSAEEIFLRANGVIFNMIEEIIRNNIKPISQKGEILKFSRRKPKMSEINENINNTEFLYNHIRMLDAEGYPKAYIETEFFKFEFDRASLKSNETIMANVRIIKKIKK